MFIWSPVVEECAVTVFFADKDLLILSAGRKGGRRRVVCSKKMDEGGSWSSQWQLINSIKSAEGGAGGGDIFQPRLKK